jgi:hypothetical protein
MLQYEAVMYLVTVLNARIAEARVDPDRGDVAEKIVIVGIFVALALAVGVLITNAVTNDATSIAKTIRNAP